MDIYLIDSAGGSFQIPVNPPEINIKRDRRFETVNVMDLGEVDFATGNKIKEISFSSFFPKEYSPSYCQYASLWDPQDAMNLMTKWMMDRNPVRLIVTETAVNVLALLTTHNSKFAGGEPGDVYYDLTLRAWQEVKVRKLGEATTSAGATVTAGKTRPDTKPIPKTYVVKDGDCLWTIAKAILGDGNRDMDIYNVPENKKLIGPDPNLIHAGQRLVMPQ